MSPSAYDSRRTRFHTHRQWLKLRFRLRRALEQLPIAPLSSPATPSWPPQFPPPTPRRRDRHRSPCSIPAPGGGTSNAVTLTINPAPQNPVPAITSLSPPSATAGGSAFTLTVNGSSFISGSAVRWNGSGSGNPIYQQTAVDAAIAAADDNIARHSCNNGVQPGSRGRLVEFRDFHDHPAVHLLRSHQQHARMEPAAESGSVAVTAPFGLHLDSVQQRRRLAEYYFRQRRHGQWHGELFRCSQLSPRPENRNDDNCRTAIRGDPSGNLMQLFHYADEPESWLRPGDRKHIRRDGRQLHLEGDDEHFMVVNPRR